MKFISILILLFAGIIPPVYATKSDDKGATYETFMLANELKVIHILPSVYVIEDQGGIAPAYSMIVDISDDNLLLVDTSDPEKTKQVLAWANKKLNNKKIVAINTHHHSDRTGGNAVLLKEKIPVYGSDLTAKLSKEKHETPPDHIFPALDGKTLSFGDKKVIIYYPGPAHSEDNVVVYIPHLKLLFGGCIVVAMQNVYLVDGVNIKNWPSAIEKLKQFDVEWVIPGHPVSLTDDLNFSPGLIVHTEMLLKTGKTAKFTPNGASAMKDKVA